MTIAEDLRSAQQAMRELQVQVEANTAAVALHEEQISGERGLSAAINSLAGEVRSLRKAAYWVAGIIVAGSLGFAFSVLQLIH